LPNAETPKRGAEEIDQGILDEGCYHLTRLGMTPGEVAARFEITAGQVTKRAARFEQLLREGKVSDEPVSRDFWRSIREEAEGNVKVTFVSEKGFHHSWRSDLRKLDGPTLLAIFESCKAFLDLDPSSRFLEYNTPKNYDPLAMQREISRAVTVVGSLLEEKWREEQSARTAKGPGPDARRPEH